MPVLNPPGVVVDGAKVREMRQMAGLTQLMLADKAKITAPYLSMIEREISASVSPPVFVRICDALGIQADQRRSMIRAKATV